MKKVFIFLSFVFITCPLVVKGVEINGIFYNLDNNLKVAEVTANPSYYSGDIVIPDIIDYEGSQYKVTTIAKNAFRSCKSLKSIIIPNSVTTIGAACFYYCETLESAKIGDGLIDIGDWAFSRCGKLNEINFPNSLKTIGEHSFSDCKSLATTLELPDNLETIGEWAFSRCSSLKQVKFGRNLRIIRSNAFNNCAELQDIYFSNNIEEVGNLAFGNCLKLAYVHIIDLASWCKINFGLNGNPLHFAHYLYLNNEIITDLVIPENVLSLGSYVFDGLEGTSNINLSNVKYIGNFAFSHSISLSKLNIPKTVVEIGYGITEGCLNLRKITVDKENSVYDSRDNSNCIIKTNGDTLVAGCSYTIIPSNVKAIGPYSFSSFYMDNIDLPENIKYIGNCAFYNCSYLKDVKLPKSLEYIGNAAFSGCPNMTTSLIIPNSVSYIGGSAFQFCSSIESITIPINIQVINNATFSQCRSLKSVEIPDNITTLVSFAFSGTGLTQLILGRNIKTIENNVFQDCNNLEDVYCYASEIPTTDEKAFENANMDATLHVPSNLVSIYKQTLPWKDFKIIEALKDGDPNPPTSLINIKDIQKDCNKYYDLNGKQVDNPSKGIYIKNGVKIVVK